MPMACARCSSCVLLRNRLQWSWSPDPSGAPSSSQRLRRARATTSRCSMFHSKPTANPCSGCSTRVHACAISTITTRAASRPTSGSRRTSILRPRPAPASSSTITWIPGIAHGPPSERSAITWPLLARICRSHSPWIANPLQILNASVCCSITTPTAKPRTTFSSRRPSFIGVLPPTPIRWNLSMMISITSWQADTQRTWRTPATCSRTRRARRPRCTGSRMRAGRAG